MLKTNNHKLTDKKIVMKYTIEMTGGSMIECTPSNGLLRLSNDVGKIVCSFRINGQSAYETPLQITLDYNYIESTQQGIQIISTP